MFRKHFATSLVVSYGCCAFIGLHFSAYGQDTACETCPVGADGDRISSLSSSRADETAVADDPVARRELTFVRRENQEQVAPRPPPFIGSAHFALRISGELTRPDEQLGQVFDQIFVDVSGEAGEKIRKPIELSLGVRTSRDCAIRGTATIDESDAQRARIRVFLNREFSSTELFGILAHEIGHLVINYEYPGATAAGPLFAEGLATWAAGAYWTRYLGAASLSAHVREVLESGRYVGIDGESSGRRVMETLFDPSQTDCLQLRDQVYTNWAAFLEFLSNTYGTDRLHLLTKLSGNSPGTPPPFSVVYGRSAAELEREWVEFLLK